MKKNHSVNKIISVVAMFAIIFGIMPTAHVQAASTVTLEQFAAYLKNSDDNQLVGVFATNILAARIVQQSSDNYVSSLSNTLTQFRLANKYGSIGLLAHNYLSGSNFTDLESGTEIFLIYGDGSTRKFKIISINKYQALSPNDPYSDFINLDYPGITLSSSDLFNETFGQSGLLILQTCISKNGLSSWGRLFVIASPV